MRSALTVLLAVTAVSLAGCADDSVGTGYLSSGDGIVLCDDQPDPETGQCSEITFSVESYMVLSHQAVATTSAGERTISLEPIRLTLEDDILYRAHPLDD